jgi:prophage endopeptidase
MNILATFFTKYLAFVLGTLLALALVALGAQTVRLANERAAHSAAVAQHQRDLRAVSDAATKAAERHLAEMKTANAQLAALDRKFTQEKAHADQTTRALRAAVDARDKRLRVHAVCPAPARSGDVPAAAVAPRVDDAAGAELTDDARSAYFSHREQIASITAQVGALQQYVRDVCPGPIISP